MLRAVLKAVVSTAASAALLAAAMLPAEHIHESLTQHSHVASHRHAAFHVEPTNLNDLTAHIESGDASHEDDAVVWLSTSAIERSRSGQAAAIVADPTASVAPMTVGIRLLPDYDCAPAHGPPRHTLDPRGPPRIPSV